MILIKGRQVVLNESIVLRKDEDQVLVEGNYGLKVQLSFINDGTAKPSLSPNYSDKMFKFLLSNFGSALGMAVSGEMTFTPSGSTGVKPMRLRYALSVHTVGEDYRCVALTVSEEGVV